MVHKLPNWAWAGAWLLACIAGYVNVIALLGFEQQAVAHLTGTTSNLATAVAQFDTEGMLDFSAVIGFFLCGSVLSGFVIQEKAFQFGYRYAVALILQVVLLAISLPLLTRHLGIGVLLVASACGLQNSMATTYSGSVVRTTHLTGVLTDFGTILGQGLRGAPMDKQRLWLYVMIISAFLGGGVAGAFAFDFYQYYGLLVPIALTFFMAVVCIFYRPKENGEETPATTELTVPTPPAN